MLRHGATDLAPPTISATEEHRRVPDSLLDRLTNLEQLFTHLERQMAVLHEVVLDKQRQIDLLEKQIRLLKSQLKNKNGDDDGSGDDTV
jgi:uncharacterized coiled-coil protein SlyX